MVRAEFRPALQRLLREYFQAYGTDRLEGDGIQQS
jgi:hypothetical protein